METLDRYEYNLKLDQMKTLIIEGKYEEAADIADSINWNKVKNVNALVKAGEVYERAERYEDAREILLNAYERSPIGRTIIYRLAEIAIKMKDFEAAKEYYEEFVDIAPHDNQKYILKYNIEKVLGATSEELISILEELKEKEYTEEWAYELADLYHTAGIIDKCVDICDELILWFGDGPYVERALELKMLYQPLTKAQEEKYKKYRGKKEGKTVIGAEEMARSGEYIHDTVMIPQITLNPSRFNTTNLQEEIVKGMQQIMEATEKETVVGTMENIKKIAEEIPYLQLPTKEELAAKEGAIHIETDEEIDGALRINFQELLGEEDDGQISLVMSEKAQLEQQITGQMTIADVLEEWEKTKRAAETALQEAEFRKLESAKARAIQEAEDIMDRLNDVLPKIEAATSPQSEFRQTSQEGVMEASMLLENMNSLLDKEISRLFLENKNIENHIRGLTQELPSLTESDLEIDIEGPEENLYNPAEEVEDEEGEEVDFGMDGANEIGGVNIKIELDSSDKILEFDNLESYEEQDLTKKYQEETKTLTLSQEQKKIFSYFIPVKGMEEQLCKALAGMIEKRNQNKTASAGNLIIQGSRGCGKTALATSFIKVLQLETTKPNGRIGKINASALNQKDLLQLMKKVEGGCLIIEQAGDLNRETAIALSIFLDCDESGMLVILEDTAIGIKKVLATDDVFAKKFTEIVSVPIFSNEELVFFAEAYAKELGYVIDEMATLALHNRISNIQKLDQATTLDEVKEIIDEAIKREAESGIRKAFNILTAKRYTDDDEIVLTEKDFE